MSARVPPAPPLGGDAMFEILATGSRPSLSTSPQNPAPPTSSESEPSTPISEWRTKKAPGSRVPTELIQHHVLTWDHPGAGGMRARRGKFALIGAGRISPEHVTGG